jgi:2,5-dioxopentanoate dehydrogenase
MNLLGTSFIGNSRGQTGGDVFHSLDAITGEALPPEYHAALPAEVDRACELAHQAFLAWRARPAGDRAAFLNRLADLMDAAVGDFVSVTCRETALPEGRIRGETGRTTGQLRAFAAMVLGGTWRDERHDPGNPDRKPLAKPDLRAHNIPVGPVAVFGASNFPLAFSTAGGDSASAWAAGCPVVFKAHPAHPQTSELTALLILQAAAETGQPEGIFSLLYDHGHTVGAALVDHPRIQSVGFTGSRRGGLALAQRAAARPRPIPVHAEMSSVNPVFLLPAALAARGPAIAAGLHGSFTMGSGQFCTCPGVVVGNFPESFVAELRALTEKTPPLPMLTPGIADAFREGIRHLRAQPGVEELAQGQPAGPRQGHATLLRTNVETVLANPFVLEEAFGPSTLLVQCNRPEDMVRLAEALEGQLTVTVHGDGPDWAAHRDLVNALELVCGRLVFNGFPTGVEVSAAMVHGGPFPATTDSRGTSVGTHAMYRFLRPVCWQNSPYPSAKA